jgi:hypothetical protein
MPLTDHHPPTPFLRNVAPDNKTTPPIGTPVPIFNDWFRLRAKTLNNAVFNLHHGMPLIGNL